MALYSPIVVATLLLMTFMHFSLCLSFHWPLIFDFFDLSNIFRTCPELAYSQSFCNSSILALCSSSLSVLLVFGRWIDALEWVSEREREKAKKTFVLPTQTHTSQMTHSHAGEQKRRSGTQTQELTGNASSCWEREGARRGC